MKKLPIVLGLVLGLFLTGAPCLANEVLDQEQVFRQVDRDRNGKIDSNEFYLYIQRTTYGILDKDSNRRMTETEWTEFEKGDNAKAVFSGMDQNLDGLILFEEFVAVRGKRQTLNNLFKTMDKNKDGVLELEELKKKD